MRRGRTPVDGLASVLRGRRPPPQLQGAAIVAGSRRTDQLDVQVYITVAARWLITRLHTFESAHPEILLRFNTSHLDWDFDDAVGDVAIVCTEHPHRPGFDYTHLFDAHMTPVCSPALVHGGIDLRQPADLVNHPLLQLYTAADEWSAWLDAAGVTEMQGLLTPRFDSYLLALEAATDGQGVAIVPTFLAAVDLRSGRLVAPFPIEVWQRRRWYVVCRRERRDDVTVRAFQEWLQGEIADDPDMYPAGTDRVISDGAV